MITEEKWLVQPNKLFLVKQSKHFKWTLTYIKVAMKFKICSKILHEKCISKIFKLSFSCDTLHATECRVHSFQTSYSCFPLSHILFPISYFEVLGFSPYIFENLSKTFTTSLTDFFFLENSGIIAYAVYKNSCWNIFRLFIFLFDLSLQIRWQLLH